MDKRTFLLLSVDPGICAAPLTHYQSTSDFPVCVGWLGYFPSVRLTGRESTGGGAFSLSLLWWLIRTTSIHSKAHCAVQLSCATIGLTITLYRSGLYPSLSFTKTYTLSNRSFYETISKNRLLMSEHNSYTHYSMYMQSRAAFEVTNMTQPFWVLGVLKIKCCSSSKGSGKTDNCVAKESMGSMCLCVVVQQE